MTKRKRFSGSNDQSGYGASEGRMLTRILRRMQASDPSANLRVKVPEPFVSQVSKIARPGHPARGKSRFLTAKAVRNDKKEKVLGCVRLRPCPSARYERGRLRLHRRSKSAGEGAFDHSRARAPAPHGAKFPKWEKGEFCTCGMLASVELYVIVRWNGRNGRGREGPRFCWGQEKIWRAGVSAEKRWGQKFHEK